MRQGIGAIRGRENAERGGRESTAAKSVLTVRNEREKETQSVQPSKKGIDSIGKRYLLTVRKYSRKGKN